MAEHLTYKGWKSTRLQLAVILFITSIIFLWTGKLTGTEWTTLIQWVFGTYAFSEVGAKGAAAMKK